MADEGFRIDKDAPRQAPARRHGKEKPAAPPLPLPPWRKTANRVGNAAMVVANALAALALLAAAYAQRVPPSELGIASMVSMAFPAAFWAAIIMFGIDVAWFRRTAWIPGLAMLACVGQIHDYFPLNLPRLPMSAEQKERSFTLMTYNVMAFSDNEAKGQPANRQLQYILEQDPDVALIEEAYCIAPSKDNSITQQQLDSMHRAYPFVLTQGENFAILSKFPVEPINLDFPSEDFVTGDIGGFRLEIYGKVVNVFPVHLRSFSLTVEDKSAYRDIVRLDSLSAEGLKDARTSIAPKIAQAAVERAEQIRYLQRYLQRYGGKNAIVAGDFNDTENSYGLYLLARESHMRQAYASTGFWPMVTYNANDLWFRIDHVLYRGDLTPYKMKRGTLKASDHYPLTVTFLMQ